MVESPGVDDDPTAFHEQRRRATLRDLRALRQAVRLQNQDLTEDQAFELANRLSHDLIDDMASGGKVTFERDRP